MMAQKQIMTKRVGIETLNEQQQDYWQKKGVEYRPILEYKPLTQEEADMGDADVGPKTESQVKLQQAKDRLKERAQQRNRNLMTLNKGDKVRLLNFKKAKSPDQYKDEPNWWPEIYEVYHVFQSRVYDTAGSEQE